MAVLAETTIRMAEAKGVELMLFMLYFLERRFTSLTQFIAPVVPPRRSTLLPSRFTPIF